MTPFLILISILVLSPAVPAAEVTVVPTVDLAKYARGQWFEIASIPQFFQRKCVGDVSAEYTLLEGGVVKVLNQCRRADGTMKTVEGRARVVDADVPAKLKVTFVHVFTWIFAFGGDYWIIDLAPDQHYAVVGHPERTYAWILARTPHLPATELRDISARLRAQGYDPCQLLTTSQGEPRDERRSLCVIEKI